MWFLPEKPNRIDKYWIILYLLLVLRKNQSSRNVNFWNDKLQVTNSAVGDTTQGTIKFILIE